MPRTVTEVEDNDAFWGDGSGLDPGRAAGSLRARPRRWI